MQAKEISTPDANPLIARRGEGVLLVMQNNADKSITIGAMNDVLEAMLGYASGEILNRKIETILGQNESKILLDDLEYEDAAPDFGDIFARIRDVKLRRRVGDEIRVNCTISRLMSQGMNACFQIVVPDERKRVAEEKLTSFISTNLDGRKELDKATGLPNRKTAIEFLPLLKNYFAESDSSIVIALVRLDRFEKSVARYGEEACNQLLMHAYNCCHSTFRSKDLIFVLSPSTLAIVLFDISRESARIVFNRLRWKIRSHRIAFGGKQDFILSTCIGFDVLNLDDAVGTLERSEAAMEAIGDSERNALLEFGDE
ncbi:MAG: diguanylate cyclase domain-containing protein [Rickettsiales bacterium]